MLATEFFFSQTFYSRTPCKHTKSQQKSTHGKYDKIQVLFFHHFPCRRHVFMQISRITSMFYKKNFIFNRIQHLKFSQKVLSIGELLFRPLMEGEEHLVVCKPAAGEFRRLFHMNSPPIWLRDYLIFTTNMRNIRYKTQALNQPRFTQEKKRTCLNFE